MSITIDSVTYQVPIINIDRKIDPLYKYAERTADGVLHSELIGVYKNYVITMGMSAGFATAYGLLLTKLSEAVESHTVTILGDTYSAYFSNVKDQLVKDKGSPYFRALSFSVIAISPAVTP